VHEAGLVTRALQHAIDERTGDASPPGRIGSLELEILDPVDVSAESARLHLEQALIECGLAGLPFRVTVAAVRCVACGATVVPGAGDAFCSGCDAPLPRREGSALRIRMVA
jgi:Zn finger protein HypA/HybF involved in hydrogenase expression